MSICESNLICYGISAQSLRPGRECHILRQAIFVTYSIHVVYEGGSICPKAGHTVYGNLLKLSEK